MKVILFPIIAAICLLAGVLAGIHTLWTDGTIQDAGLCLIVGAAAAAWFQSE